MVGTAPAAPCSGGYYFTVMMVIGWFIYALLAVIVLAVIVLAERHYGQLAGLPTSLADQNDSSASVEIIVPARNESAVIERVVNSLVALDYPNKRITVVDDASTDDTAAKAEAAGATVLRLAGDPPPGWTGKCYACQQAAQRSTVEWLLFTDADTHHTPASLTRAIHYAHAHQLDALSLLLRQECMTLWEQAVLPIAYQGLFATMRSGEPVFNGQYILIRRDVYEQSGGFSAVRGRVMEDIALARHLAKQGCRIALLNSEDSASVRMYTSFTTLLRGMSKTAFSAAREQGWVGVMLSLYTLVGTLAPLLLIGSLLLQSTLAAGVGLLLITLITIGSLRWMRRFDVPRLWRAPLLALLGVTTLLGIGMYATGRALLGQGVQWKGRTIVEAPNIPDIRLKDNT